MDTRNISTRGCYEPQYVAAWGVHLSRHNWNDTTIYGEFITGSSGVAMGIIATVDGILVLFWFEAARWVFGIFLIVWGVLAIMNRR